MSLCPEMRGEQYLFDGGQRGLGRGAFTIPTGGLGWGLLVLRSVLYASLGEGFDALYAGAALATMLVATLVA